MRSRERRTKRAGRRTEVDRGNGLGVACVGIGVVSKDVAAGGRAARAIGNATLLGGVGRVGDSRRRGVRRCRHDNIECLAGGEATEIGSRDLDPERADICSRRRAAERACRGIEAQPSGERRAVGGGRRVGEAVAGIDVGEGAGGQHQREGRANARVLAAGLRRKRRRVVGAVNG